MARAAGTLVVGLVVAWAAMADARAQDASSGTIAGVVRDEAGGVVPGVTVEASSPALIEKVRVVTTDGDGRYRIIDLRPGVYAVTFTLSGFKTVRREGIELTTGFTATVNGELEVGAIEETITVVGATPVVDVTGVGQQQVFSGETLRVLPIGKNAGVYTALIPGAMQNSLADQDVGGTKGESTQRFVVHGGRQNDAFQLRDGMYFGSHIGVGGNYNSSVNPATVEEVQVQTTGGLTAEAMSGGVQINVIPRDGGNEFHGTVAGDFGHRRLQSDNLSDELRQRGAAVAAYIRQLYDAAAGIGGPIRGDRVWFFASARKWVSSSYIPGNYYNNALGTLFYEPDLSRPAYDRNLAQEGGVRLTIQASQKHKFTATSRWEYNCNCNFALAAGTHAPEVAGSDWYPPMRTTQGTWTYPATNRLLVQVGAIELGGVLERRLADGVPASATREIAVFNQLTNFWSGGSDRSLFFTQNMSTQDYAQRNVTGSVSYVTGSHNFKVGGLFLKSSRDLTNRIYNEVTYTFAGTVPQSVTYWASPVIARMRTTQTALYAQEQWTLRQLTLNLGLRYEGQIGYVPPTEMPAGTFVPARSFGEVKDVPNWKDVNPRLGFAYDLFGNGKTAVKGTLGRFVIYEANGGIVFNANPSNTFVTSATRTWNDLNGNYVPDQNELGPISNANFGRSVAPNTVYSEEVLRGWGNRGYNWQGSLAVQHELTQGVGVNVGYFRTWYGNFLVTDNVLVSPDDFDSYCITSPSNERLPNGGSERICGLLDPKPSAFGRVSNVVKLNSAYGGQQDAYDGVDVTLNARVRDGGLITGGFSTGRVTTDVCEVVARVPELAINMAANAALTANHIAGPTNAPSRFCNIDQAWSALTQLKLSGTYRLPWGITASVNYQNIAGLPTTAQHVVSGAEIAGGLGRPPSAGARATALVELIEPQTQFREKRLNQVNLAFTRGLRFGSSRVQPRIEIANAFNASTVTQMTTRYGPAWEAVRGYLPPRLIKFGAQVDF